MTTLQKLYALIYYVRMYGSDNSVDFNGYLNEVYTNAHIKEILKILIPDMLNETELKLVCLNKEDIINTCHKKIVQNIQHFTTPRRDNQNGFNFLASMPSSMIYVYAKKIIRDVIRNSKPRFFVDETSMDSDNIGGIFTSTFMLKSLPINGTPDDMLKFKEDMAVNGEYYYKQTKDYIRSQTNLNYVRQEMARLSGYFYQNKNQNRKNQRSEFSLMVFKGKDNFHIVKNTFETLAKMYDNGSTIDTGYTNQGYPCIFLSKEQYRNIFEPFFVPFITKLNYNITESELEERAGKTDDGDAKKTVMDYAVATEQYSDNNDDLHVINTATIENNRKLLIASILDDSTPTKIEKSPDNIYGNDIAANVNVAFYKALCNSSYNDVMAISQLIDTGFTQNDRIKSKLRLINNFEANTKQETELENKLVDNLYNFANLLNNFGKLLRTTASVTYAINGSKIDVDISDIALELFRRATSTQMFTVPAEQTNPAYFIRKNELITIDNNEIKINENYKDIIDSFDWEFCESQRLYLKYLLPVFYNNNFKYSLVDGNELWEPMNNEEISARSRNDDETIPAPKHKEPDNAKKSLVPYIEKFAHEVFSYKKKILSLNYIINALNQIYKDVLIGIDEIEMPVVEESFLKSIAKDAIESSDIRGDVNKAYIINQVFTIRIKEFYSQKYDSVLGKLTENLKKAGLLNVDTKKTLLSNIVDDSPIELRDYVNNTILKLFSTTHAIDTFNAQDDDIIKIKNIGSLFNAIIKLAKKLGSTSTPNSITAYDVLRGIDGYNIEDYIINILYSSIKSLNDDIDIDAINDRQISNEVKLNYISETIGNFVKHRDHMIQTYLSTIDSRKALLNDDIRTIILLFLKKCGKSFDNETMLKKFNITSEKFASISRL